MVRQLLKIGLSIGVSFTVLALLLKLVNSDLPDEQRPSVVNALQSTSLELVLGFVLVSLITLFVRALRYRLLISMSGEQNVPTLPQMALVTGVRNMVVDMLPARLGELGYVGLLNRGYGVKLQHCVSSLTVSVAFDFVALMVVVILLLAKQFVGAAVEGWAITALFVSFVLSLLALLGLFIITPLVSRWLSRILPAQSPTTWWGRLLAFLDDFCNSLLAVRTAGKTVQVLSMSVLIRLLKYFSLYLLFMAVAAPTFTALAQLPAEQVISALIGGEVGASLPLPTFMSFGAYEAGSALVFSLLGVAEQAEAVVTMLCVHIWSQLMDYSLGGALLVTFFWLKRRGEQQAALASSTRGAAFLKWGSYAFSVLILGLGSMFLAYQLWAASKLGSISPPATGSASSDASQWREQSAAAVRNLDGFVVFSSNRDGNHDIFKLNLASFELQKITSHEHTETYPRISPDGKRLIFSRAHEPWVSQRNVSAWDVYLLDMASGAESLIGKNGTAPAWVSNAEVTFVQNGVRVVKVNVNTGQRETLLEGGQNGSSLPSGSVFHNAKYNPISGQVAFTGRQSQIGMSTGHWGTALASPSDHTGVLNGCELAWDSGYTSMFQVYQGGLDGSLRIVKVDPDNKEVETLIDLNDGHFVHEYWPKDSANSAGYMVFGASRSAKEHEHDVADYEIFLWEKGTDSGTATRLTFHTGNDNWPDVFIRNAQSSLE